MAFFLNGIYNSIFKLMDKFIETTKSAKIQWNRGVSTYCLLFVVVFRTFSDTLVGETVILTTKY